MGTRPGLPRETLQPRFEDNRTSRGIRICLRILDDYNEGLK